MSDSEASAKNGGENFFLGEGTLMFGSLAAVMLALIYLVMNAWTNNVSLFSPVSHLILENPMIQSIIVSSSMAGFLYLCAYVAKFVKARIFARYYRSIAVSSKDENYQPVLEYISKNYMTEGARLNMVTGKKKRKTWKEWRDLYAGIGRVKLPDITFLPSNDAMMTMFSYKNKNIIMTRSKGQTITAGYDRKPLELETMTLAVYGEDNTILKELINDSLMALQTEINQECTIYVLSATSWMGGWEKAMSKKPRSVESVVLDENLDHDLLQDAKEFLSSSEWYTSRGIPYRRGYLLHGVPGCGKTSLCQALAGALNLDVCMLSLGGASMTDKSLAQDLRDAPPNAIILLEDVDAVFTERKKTAKNDFGGGVSFSGLLNALDGVASQEGRLFFMTTNHIERLDPALIRPGRCDVHVELKRASKYQMTKLFLRFFPNEEKAASQFAAALPSEQLSMASLQGHFLEHKTVESALLAVPRLLEMNKPKQVEIVSIYQMLHRVGLQQWAPAFEYHGYQTRDDVLGGGLDVKKVVSWCPMLHYDSVELERMRRLLTTDAKFMDGEYSYQDLSTVREAFLAAYMTPSSEKDRPLLFQAPISIGLVRSNSQEQKHHRKISETEDDRLQRLCNDLCATVTVNGRSKCTLFHLRHILRLCPNDPARCVDMMQVIMSTRDNADNLTCASGSYTENYLHSKHKITKDEVDSKGLNSDLPLHAFSLSSAVFLRRAGLQEYAKNAIGAGIPTTAELCNATKEDIDKIIVVNVPKPVNGKSEPMSPKMVRRTADKRVLTALITRDAKNHENMSRLVTCPDRAQLVTQLSQVLFLDNVGSLADYLCDDFGCGYLSVVELEQLMKHLTSMSSQNVTVNVIAQWIQEHFDASMTASSEPEVDEEEQVDTKEDVKSKWLREWLQAEADVNPKVKDLLQYIPNFVKENLISKDDLILPDLLDQGVLAGNCGVASIGHQRLFCRLLADLEKSS